MKSSKTHFDSAVSTDADVIRRALEPEQLGINASPGAIREWGEWIYPTVSLPQDGYEQKVEAIRKEVQLQMSDTGDRNHEK